MPKTPEHEVKVRFAREFADVGPVVTRSVPESLSSASSFHSLTSTLSTNSSSGICPDSSFDTPDDIAANTSYTNTNIPGVEELILACADINLGSERINESAADVTQDLDCSQDQTFTSATDEAEIYTSDFSLNEKLLLGPAAADADTTQVIEPHSQAHASPNQTSESSSVLPLSDKQHVSSTEEHVPQTEEEESFEKLAPSQKSDDTTSETETCSITSSTIKDSSVASNAASGDQLDVPATVSPDISFASAVTITEERTVASSHSAETLSLEDYESCATHISAPSTSEFLSLQNAEGPYSPPNVSDVSSPLECADKETKNNSAHDLSGSARGVSALSSTVDTDQKSLAPITENSSDVRAEEKSEVAEERDSPRLDKEENSARPLREASITKSGTPKARENSQTSLDTQDSAVKNNAALIETRTFVSKEDLAICNETRVVEQRNPSETVIIQKEEDIVESAEKESVNEKKESLDRTLTLQDADLDFAAASCNDDQTYLDFKPQRQSTTLTLPKEKPNFEEVKSTVEKVTDDLLNSSLELAEETETFVSATSTSKCKSRFSKNKKEKETLDSL